MEILMVCTGNICRSPMAEGLLRARLAEQGCGDEIEVRSAGTWATYGHPPTIEAIQAAGARGASIDEHRSSPVLAPALEQASLVVAMTSVHVRELATLAPEVMGKVRLLKELPELEVGEPLPASAEARVSALLDATRPAPRRALDLDDPIGLPYSAYDRCADEIVTSVDLLATWLCPGDQ